MLTDSMNILSQRLTYIKLANSSFTWIAAWPASQDSHHYTWIQYKTEQTCFQSPRAFSDLMYTTFSMSEGIENNVPERRTKQCVTVHSYFIDATRSQKTAVSTLQQTAHCTETSLNLCFTRQIFCE